MAVCKKYSQLIQDLLKQQQENKITTKELSQKLSKCSDGEVEICIDCKNRYLCFESI